MRKFTQNDYYLALIFIVATAIVVYFMPRESRFHYSYEENRPWTYSTLMAPFDITVYRDSATVKQMIDSVESSMVPIFRRDNERSGQVVKALEGNNKLTDAMRSKLKTAIERVYRIGVVDQDVATRIARGELPEVKFQENNVNVTHSTANYLSPRDAYAYVDSLMQLQGVPHSVQEAGLQSLLDPNIVEDTDATRQYRETLIQPIVAGIGVIQKGERIVAQGDIVTPQLYQILKTYEATLEKYTNYDHIHRRNALIGQTLIVMLLLGALYTFLWFNDYRKLSDVKRVLPLMLLVVLFFVFAVAVARTFRYGIYMVPLAALPVIVTVFYGSRTAFFATAIEVMLCSVVASFPLEFMLVELVSSMAVLFSLRELSQRSELLKSAAVAFMAYVLTYVSFELMSAGSLTSISWRLIGFFAINAVLISFAYILIFVIEKMFDMVSVVTLVELSDINNKVLRDLSSECPGTFQHCMAVSNLATEAAHRIGANVQVVRAGALYHDIGKIDNPAFFTENQHGVNPHDTLTPLQSARIIIRHVTDGLKRAEREQLPIVVRDLIAQHHGRGKAKYFYTMYCRDHDDGEQQAEAFTYPGPNPQTREASVLMMADTIEAASRSMSSHTKEAITELVNRLIDAQVADGLHNDSPLSFRDIRDIKQCFISRLQSMYHARVSYPPEVKRTPQTTTATTDNDTNNTNNNTNTDNTNK
jgi:hypothetical protein